MEIKSWLKNIGVDRIKNGCGHSGQTTLKLTVSQKGIDRLNWFFWDWKDTYETKINSQRRNVVIKNMFWYFYTVLKNMIIKFSVAVVLITKGHYLVIINSSV